MKRIYLLFALFALACFEANAQISSEEPYEFFIDVALNHGKEYTAATAFNNEDKEWICDESGKKIKFKNKSNIINYFTKKGWTFVQINTFVITVGMSPTVTDYILFKKCVKNEEEAKQDIKLESDFKKK